MTSNGTSQVSDAEDDTLAESSGRNYAHKMAASNSDSSANETNGFDITNANSTDHGVDGGGSPLADSAQKQKQTRRAVACKSCHGLKVKCTPSDEDNPAGPCLRCLNANRKCEIDLNQTRKRRKKAEILAALEAAALQPPLAPEKAQLPPAAAQAPFTAGLNGSYVPLDPQHKNGSHFGYTMGLPPANITFPSLPSPHPKPEAPENGSNSSTAHAGPVNTAEAGDPSVSDLKGRISYLESVVKRQQEELSTRTPLHSHRDSSSDMESPPFVSKFDLVHELNVICDMSSKLSETSNELKLLSERRTLLLKQSQQAVDCVSVGILTVEEARERLDLYRVSIYPSHPLVYVPPELTVEEMQHDQPYLLNAVMSVTNAISNNKLNPDQLIKIDNFAILSLTFEIMALGTKSVELIKSLLLLCLWYNTPEFFKHRRYHLLNTISVTMLHDLGIIAVSLNAASQAEKAEREKEQAEQTGQPATSDTAEIYPSIGTPEDDSEYNSLILIIYFTTVSICLILRRTIYVKWTPYIEECCVQLEKQTDVRSRHIALFSRLSNLLERIHQIVHSQDTSERRPASSHFIIYDFQQALNGIKLKIKPDDHCSLAFFYSVEAYLHEPCLTNVFLYDSRGDANTKLTETSIKLISHCNDSCLNALNEFNQLSPTEIAKVPMFLGSRAVYTVGMLLRLRCLILALPSNIEKELVPRDALFAIQKCNRLVAEASALYSNNYSVMKTRLVLQLFIQTYSSQIQELIKKNGSNFLGKLGRRHRKLIVSAGRYAHLFAPLMYGSKSLSTDATTTAIPLDLLSFAASSFKRNEESSSAQGSPPEEVKPFKVPYGSPTSGSPWNNYQSPVPAPTIPAIPKQGPSQQQDQPGPQFPQHYHPPAQFNQTIPPILQQMPQLMPTQLPPQLPPQLQQQQLHRNSAVYRTMEMPLHAANLSNLANSVNIHNMASSELLENSYMAVNDEFWSDLLSAEADKINFSNNNNNNGTQFHEEVFYMK